MTTKVIDNSADYLDSRDIIARIEELEAERDDLQEKAKEAREAAEEPADDEAAREALDDAKASADDDLAEWHLDNDDEYNPLKALADECDGVGDLPKDLPSYIEIDWDATAENLKADYTTVNFDGVDYYVR